MRDDEQPDARPDVTPKALPKGVQVFIGGHWLSATAHATRYGRRGQQVLIDHYGRLVWVSASRLRPWSGRGPSGRRRPGVFAAQQEARPDEDHTPAAGDETDPDRDADCTAVGDEEHARQDRQRGTHEQ
ncbi:hypothetical protein [Kribbella shirazensis]|uniref:Uncharacterized protein n=1 Tax=Kribbella shirazensis TaxID=1105143 RepID=A0A7X5VDM3_9ACTN|nr:hypothetical protein [Kribbella shirazensis]NIK59289.1 hypothetical protein [Kribbella shirazensis]